MELSDVRGKALRIYDSKEIFRSYLENRNLFPMVMALPRISSRELSENFSDYRARIEKLTGECRDSKLELRFKSLNHRTLGEQSIPQEICFASQDLFLKFIAKEKEFARFKRVVTLIMEEVSQLAVFVAQHPEKILEFEDSWGQLLIVCKFLMANPQSNLYIRQLEIPGIDTKFIENHKRILAELLPILLPQDGAIPEGTSSSVELFEKRYGLRKEEARLRFRLLDLSLRGQFCGLEDIETSVADIADNEIPCKTVVIIENKITGLCLPNLDKTLVFFELGYKANLLKRIPWLQHKKMIYWGDIDTHGFAILSRLRLYFPQIQSQLMNRETLQKYKLLWTKEETPFIGECPGLNAEEQELFQDLKWNRLGTGVRLEQERIPLSDFRVPGTLN